jgi:asparagine synthase (glutamine-hydrolysing)
MQKLKQMEIYTVLSAKDWHRHNNTVARGYCFDTEDHLYNSTSLAKYFDDIDDEPTLRERLKNSNGIFSVIINKPHFKALAIDSSRIYPLFYKCNGKVSDNANLLIDKKSAIDSSALCLYEAGSAPLEGETLVNNIKQVKPSGYVIFVNNGCKSEKYYDLLVSQQDCKTKDAKELEHVMLSALDRSIKSIGDRQIVIPLSGGYDSRLIVCMLRKLNYSNVLCYTVGDETSFEVQIVRKVTKYLGYKHIVVDNATSFVDAEITNEKDFKSYYMHMGSLGNFVYIFEYAAVKSLKRRNIINDDAVFIPGHSGDFWGGAYVRKSHIRPTDNKHNVASSIMYDILEFAYSHKALNIIQTTLDDNHTPHSQIQNFVMNYTLAHIINNSARVYEFFGHEVRLPFWDREIMDFFKNLSCDLFVDNRIYYNFAHSLFTDFNVDFRQPEVTPADIKKQWWRNRIKKTIPKFLAVKFVKRNNITNELYLCKPLLEELRKKNAYGNKFYSINELMKEWYLMKVKEQLQTFKTS